MSISINKKTSKDKQMMQHYESLFTKEQMELLSSQPDYWDTFFLLPPNCSCLQSHIKDSLKKGKKLEAIKLLFSQCTVALKEENNVRIANALLTICLVSRLVLIRKKKLSHDPIDVLIGQDHLDVKMEILRTRLCELLFLECVPSGSKSLILEFLLILVTACRVLQDNPLIDHLMSSDHLFDAFVNASLTLTSRQVLGFKALLLLTLLVNYKKNGSSNPFIVKLSLIHDEVVLNAFAHVICSEFCDFNRRYELKHEPCKSSGIFSSLTNMVGSMFIADDDSHSSNNVKLVKACPIKPSNSLLLALYHAIHLNRNFIILLTNFAAEPLDDFQFNGFQAALDTVSQSSVRSADSTSGPSNLLVSFLEFCSIVMLNTKDEASCKTSRLCFIILTCISEDQCANGIMHDSNIAFRVSLHRMPMRHRKVSHDMSKPSKPLAHTVLDLMVEFILSNLRKSLPLDLHSFALGIIHRIICYQKKCKIRFNYPWTEIWSALISLIKYLVNHETDLLRINSTASSPSSSSSSSSTTTTSSASLNLSGSGSSNTNTNAINNNNSNSNNNSSNSNNILSLVQTSINIFNLFITFGDTFLASDHSYDQLYYEIIRMHIVFDNLYLLCSRFTAMDASPFKQASCDIVNSLTNIRSIINHFNPKIDTWKSQRDLESLTEENVLDVVRSNYDSLVVMLQDGLDSYESYSSQAGNERIFFQEMLQQVISEYRDAGIKDQEYMMKHAALVQEIQVSLNSSHQQEAADHQVVNKINTSNRDSVVSQSATEPNSSANSIVN